MQKKIAKLLKKAVERTIFEYEGAIRTADFYPLMEEIMEEIDSHLSLLDDGKKDLQYDYDDPDILSGSCIRERPMKKKPEPALDDFLVGHPLMECLDTLESWKIKPDLLRGWIRIYPADFLVEELKKASLWVTANAHKAPKKNYGAFFTRWIGKSWEAHRRKLPGNKASKAHPATLELDE